MGAENLQERSNGQVINSEWWNLIHRALQQDILPRNAAGLVTDVAGSLGSAAYRWAAAYLKSIKLVSDSSNSVSITAPDALAAPYELTLPDALPSVIKKVVCAPDGQLSFGGNVAKGTDSDMLSSSSTTWQTIASVSSFTCTGRPVLVCLVSNGSTTLTEASYMSVGAVGGSNYSAFLQVRLMRDGVTEVAAYRVGVTSSVAAQTLLLPSCLMFLDEAPSAGSHSYTLEGRLEESGDVFEVYYAALVPMEW